AQADRDAAAAVIAAEAARIAALRPVPAQASAPLELPAAPALSLDDPASLWVVVNKARPLDGGSTYVPSDLVIVPVAHTFSPLLRQEASAAVVALFDAAQAEAGLTLASNSAYRAYSVQQRVYGSIVAASGQAYADTTSARPGHSEHQTGLSLDIGAVSGRCSLNACFAETAEGQWLAGNAWRFGFELRYPDGMEAVTGFNFEPWHYRYLGVDLATTLHESGVTTLEEHFGLAAAPDYR
ncbi:D-alanyl-D-alanine carboxypeptidase family protein, partial [Cryobacterium melibiosiphilum]